MTACVDQEARDIAITAKHDLNNHKAVVGVQLGNVEKAVNELKGQLKWAAGIIVMLFISTLTWSLAQQYNANEAQQKDLQQQIQLLREQERARVTARSEILSRLPAGTPESALTADRLGQSSDLRDARPNNGGQD